MQALLFLSLLAPAPDATKDTANLEGTWVVVSALTDGKAEDEIKGEKMTFKDGKLTITTKKKDEQGTYKIDPAQKPKTIDVTEGGKNRTHRGIYKLDGDKLTLCVPTEPDGARPADFTAKEGEKNLLIELKREKK